MKASHLSMLSEEGIRQASRFRCVRDFMRAFSNLDSTHQRDKVAREIADFINGWRDGIGDLDAECDDEPQVLSVASGNTLAETMSDMGIRPGTKAVPS